MDIEKCEDPKKVCQSGMCLNKADYKVKMAYYKVSLCKSCLGELSEMSRKRIHDDTVVQIKK